MVQIQRPAQQDEGVTEIHWISAVTIDAASNQLGCQRRPQWIDSRTRALERKLGNAIERDADTPQYNRHRCAQW